ncbi:MAG: hypothetical protein KA099_02030 [Alphaproteobacteria bacterium]|nr:hypothetical protein [Alphaproteobacteria bacterium]MBP7758586.1 hypothetical protein [Alphaproteobacteria bacterium]MBP7762018.1 hypothetical protein [Alphaproteobacteria bacterium]MBP7904081.1 hypothetical protein [Alphaproteobacteria bacterium]
MKSSLVFLITLFVLLPSLSYAGSLSAIKDTTLCKNETYEKLYRGLSEGSYQSLIDFVRCRDNHDGGNLADLFIQAGSFIVINPALYIYILEQESVPFDGLENFFVMLSPDLVDDIDGQTREIDKRLDALKNVRPSAVRDRGIQELEKSKAFLEDIKN